MQRWGALLLVAIAGCTTGITAPMDMAAPAPDDLSTAAAGDLAGGCTLAFSGDVTMTVACRVFLCHPTDGADDELDLAGPLGDSTGAHAIFGAKGLFMAQSYAFADLRGIDVGITVGGKRYLAQGSAAGGVGTGAITITGVTRPSASDPCSGSAHGTATATLDEDLVDDGGMTSTGAGRVTLLATF